MTSAASILPPTVPQLIPTPYHHLHAYLMLHRMMALTIRTVKMKSQSSRVVMLAAPSVLRSGSGTHLHSLVLSVVRPA